MSDNPLAPALDAIAARLKADAERIAELEAELAALKANRDELIRMVGILKSARAEEGGE